MSQSKTKSLAFLAVLSLAVLLLSAVVAVDVDAARGAGRGGGKKGGGTTYTGTCAATPNPVALGEVVTISGSGAAPNALLGYTWSDANGVGGGWVTADANGNFGLSGSTFVLGTSTVTFGGVATCSFQVV